MDGKPLILDVELGKALGMARPRDVRQLLSRYEVRMGGAVTYRATFVRGKPVQEALLTEAQVLFLASKSDTAKGAQVLNRGGLPFDCYVLEDGRRVVSQRGILRGLLGPDGRKAGDLGAYLKSLPSKNKVLATDAIEFQSNKGGLPAMGRDTPWVIAFLKAYTEAHRAGKLHASQFGLPLRPRWQRGDAGSFETTRL